MTITDAALNRALRSADPAPATLSAEQTIAKDALLHRILTAPAAPGLTRSPLPASRIRRRALWFGVPGLAAATLAAGALLAFSPAPDAAAAWTPVPGPVDADTATSAQDACLRDFTASLSRLNDGPLQTRPITSPASLRPVVAESRGNVLFVAMAAPDGTTHQCFSSLQSPGNIIASGGGLATKDSQKPPALTANQIDAPYGGGSFFQGSNGFVYKQGRVGANVRGVLVHASGVEAQATVSNGYFAAWWPTKDPMRETLAAGITYDLTLSDGTVIANAEPVR